MSDLAVHGLDGYEGAGKEPTGSSLGLAAKCPPSHVLPQVRRSGGRDRSGSAMHEHLMLRARLGMGDAVNQLAETARKFDLDEKETAIFIARARSFEWSPPRGTITELSLCLMEDGRVTRIEGGRGTYKRPPGAVLPIQIDAFWAEPTPLYLEEGRVRCPPESTLWVVDFKTGKEVWVDPVERNWQARAGVAIAAHWVGATQAVPAIVYVRKGQGVWDCPDSPYDVHELDAIAHDVKRALGRVRDERSKFARRLPMNFNEGQHCTYCDAEVYCTAKVGQLKAFLDDPAPFAPATLSLAQTRKLAQMLPSIDRFAVNARAALKAATKQAPIEMAPGLYWGPHLDDATEIRPEVALQILGEEIGEEAARQAVAASTSRAAIEAAIKAAHAEQGIARKVAPATRRVMARLKEAGGLVTTPKVRFGPFKSEHPPALFGEAVAELSAAPEEELIVEGDD